MYKPIADINVADTLTPSRYFSHCLTHWCPGWPSGTIGLNESVQSDKTGTQNYLCTSVLMLVGRKCFELGNFFFLIFSANILTLNGSLHIFGEFFKPQKKFAKNVSTFILCRNICIKNLETKIARLKKISSR